MDIYRQRSRSTLAQGDGTIENGSGGGNAGRCVQIYLFSLFGSYRVEYPIEGGDRQVCFDGAENSIAVRVPRLIVDE